MTVGAPGGASGPVAPGGNAPTPGTSPPPFSATVHKTYTSLVQGDQDVVGHMAYAFYKRDKLKFCADTRARHGRDPLTHEIEVFIQTCNLDTVLQRYRTEAEELLERLTEYQLEDAIEEVKKVHNEELVKRLSEGKSWGRVAIEALIGSFAVAILWAALAMVLYWNKFGWDRVAKDVFGVTVSSSPDAAASSPAGR